MSFAGGPTLERPHTRPLRSLLFIAGSDEKRVPEAPMKSRFGVRRRSFPPKPTWSARC